MKKILVPIDGSLSSKKAAEQAIDLARLFGSEITFLSVVELNNGMAFTDMDGVLYGRVF